LPPRTWRGIIRRRNRFEVRANDAVAALLNRGVQPTKRQICDELGLDYDNGDDRAKVSLALHKHKKLFDYAWRDVYVGSGAYERDYGAVSADHLGYETWRRQEAELYRLLTELGLQDSEIREFWVHSRLWERFVTAANQWNLHLFVAFGHPFVPDSWLYKQPNYWEYVVKQVEIARKLQKGVLTILERHRDLGMILTSAESVGTAIQVAQDTLQMIADGIPLRHRCELCSARGLMIAFRTQAELFEHWRQQHQVFTPLRG